MQLLANSKINLFKIRTVLSSHRFLLTSGVSLHSGRRHWFGWYFQAAPRTLCFFYQARGGTCPLRRSRNPAPGTKSCSRGRISVPSVRKEKTSAGSDPRVDLLFWRTGNYPPCSHSHIYTFPAISTSRGCSGHKLNPPAAPVPRCSPEGLSPQGHPQQSRPALRTRTRRENKRRLFRWNSHAYGCASSR